VFVSVLLDTSAALVHEAPMLSFATLATSLRLLLARSMILRLDKVSDDLMIVDLVHFDFIERAQDFDILSEDVVFLDCGHCRRVMLLEAHDHMADKRALRWQKGATRLQCHGVPHLAVLQSILLELIAAICIILHATLLGLGAFTSIELLG
jgi:hypothetical protein